MSVQAKLYQVFHWWHWLTYGQGFPNAVALATVFAGITAVAVVKYTRDQAAIRRSQDLSFRSGIEPILIMAEITPTPYGRQFVVRNYGSGAAINVIFWTSSAREGFGIFQTRSVGHSAAVVGDMLGSDAIGKPFGLTTQTQKSLSFLLVVQAEDQSGRRHQVHWLASPARHETWRVSEPVKLYIGRKPARSIHSSLWAAYLRRRLRSGKQI